MQYLRWTFVVFLFFGASGPPEVKPNEVGSKAQRAQRKPSRKTFFSQRAWLGVRGARSKVCTIGSVTTLGPAEIAGLKSGDVITHYRSNSVKDFAHLVSLIRASSPGDTVSLKIKRGSRSFDAKVKLANWDFGKRLVLLNAGTLSARRHILSGIVSYSGIVKLVGDVYVGKNGGMQIAIDDELPNWIYVRGDLHLDGLLDIVFAKYAPKAGDAFELATAEGTLYGKFRRVKISRLPKGLRGRVVYDDLKSGVDFDGDAEYDVTLVIEKSR